MPGPVPSNPRKTSGGPVPINELIDKRWDLQRNMFKPEYSLPSKTIEEYVDSRTAPVGV